LEVGIDIFSEINSIRKIPINETIRETFNKVDSSILL